MGVYGNLLGYFSHLQKVVYLLKMPPRIGAGYYEREVLDSFNGYVNFARKKETSVVADSIQFTEVPNLYTRKELQQGSIVEYEGDVYRVKAKNSHYFEGGYMEYRLEMIASWTDIQEETAGLSSFRGFS